MAVSIFFVVFFLYLSLIFNESFFLKYSEDKNLQESTIKKIQELRLGFLTLEIFSVFIVLVIFKKRKKITDFIGKNKNIIQNLFLLIIIMIIMFAALEISLRIMFHDKTTSYNAGPTLRFNKKYVEINKEGFRDDEFVIEKYEKIRIAVLGDSFAYGWGIKDIKNSFPDILEEKLIDKGEVYNFGLPGMDTEDELKILKENALDYNPDIVIISYLPNDQKDIDKSIEKHKYFRINIPFSFWLRNYFYSFFYLELQINRIQEAYGKKISYQDYLVKTFESEINRDYNKNLFSEISKIAEEKNVKVLVVVFPMLYNLDNYSLKISHDFVKEMAKKNNFYYLDLLDIYRNYDIKDITLNKYDIHPNELGHKLAGEAVYEKLKAESLV